MHLLSLTVLTAFAFCFAFTKLAKATPIGTLAVKDTKFFFGFGDSYTCTRNSASGGPVWLEYLAKAADASLAEFAVGGATVDNTIKKNNGIPDFVQQTSDFLRRNPAGSGWQPSSTRFAIFFGINNIGQSNASTDELEKDLPTIIATMKRQIQRIYNVGGRHFLIVKVPAISRAPAHAGAGKFMSDYIESATKAFNSALDSLQKDLSVSLLDAEVSTFDSYALWTKMLDAPESWGFANWKSVCDIYANDYTAADEVADPACDFPLSRYFYASALHPSFTVHRYMSDAIVAQLS